MSSNHCANSNSKSICESVLPALGSAGREISSSPLALEHHLLSNYTVIRSGIITFISIIIAQNTLEFQTHNVMKEFKTHEF